MPDEIFWQLRFEPARWIAEKHVIKVYVGTDGTHQDEFLRGDHPATLFKGSIATPSLEAAIINSKYVNSNPLDRISRDFGANGLNVQLDCMDGRALLISRIRDDEAMSAESPCKPVRRNDRGCDP